MDLMSSDIRGALSYGSPPWCPAPLQPQQLLTITTIEASPKLEVKRLLKRLVAVKGGSKEFGGNLEVAHQWYRDFGLAS